MKKIIFLLLYFFIAHIQYAQTPISPELRQQALKQLQDKGLEENVIREKLQQRGINIDQITKEQLPTLQKTIEEVVKEAEAEKTAAQAQQTPAAATKTENIAKQIEKAVEAKADAISQDKAADIQQKVQAGASVKEAISEEITKTVQANLPPPKIYGQHLFRDKSLALYRTTNDVKPPDSYILSTGDEITISIFGASQFDGKYIINSEGFIQPVQMPKIFLKGVTLGEARRMVKSRFGQAFRFTPEQLTVNLTTARAVSINIFGEVQQYGSFTLSAVNTAFNALVAAGGPSDIGSVRNIKLIRGKTTKKIDVYEFMNNPAKQYELFLEDNDIIHVPVAERVVEIQGAIRRPYAYELLENENLKKLIDYAGGIPANAFQEIIQIKRFENDEQRLIDVELKKILTTGSDFLLKNGDVVIIKTIPTPIENTASIEGTVNLPGSYSLSDTKKISDLIKKADVKKEARTDVAFLFRKNNDNTTKLIQINLNQILTNIGAAQDLPLMPEDKVIIYPQERYITKFTFSVNGAIREAIKDFPYSPDSTITIQKAILLAGGLKQDANGLGYILRIDPNDLKEKQYIPVNIQEALRNPNGIANEILKPSDQLEVLSQLSYTDNATVRVRGAVRKEGTYQYGKTMTLRDVLTLSGGFAIGAAYNRVDIFRLILEKNQPTRTVVATLQVDSLYNVLSLNGAKTVDLMPFDEVVVRNVPEFELLRFVEIRGEVKYPGQYALLNDNEKLSSIINRAGGVTNEAFLEGSTLFRKEGGKGYVVTNFKEAMQHENANANHILKENDVIEIPKQEDLVSIRTAYTNADEVLLKRVIANGLINVSFTPGKCAKWYINEYAAGFDKEAAKSKVRVEQPNGKINRTINLGLFKIYPKVTKGSIISVSPKIKKEKAPEKPKKERDPFDWNKALTQILAFMSATATIIIAISAINK